MLTSKFDLFRQLQVINSFKYVKMEFHYYNRDLYNTFKIRETWFIIISNSECHYLQFR